MNKREIDEQIIDNEEQWRFQPGTNLQIDAATKFNSLFERRKLENSVLWIRVDPDHELIRKVKIAHSQKHWIYQLLKDKELPGQYEAIHALKKLNNEDAYFAIQSVIENKEYFVKIRKEAARALAQMDTNEFNKFLSISKYFLKVIIAYESNMYESIKSFKKQKEEQGYHPNKGFLHYPLYLLKSLTIKHKHPLMYASNSNESNS